MAGWFLRASYNAVADDTPTSRKVLTATAAAAAAAAAWKIGQRIAAMRGNACRTLCRHIQSPHCAVAEAVPRPEESTAFQNIPGGTMS